MIVTFRTAATGDVIMFGDVAKHMMGLMGKEATAQGIVTVEQLPAAIEKLRAAIAADKQRRSASDDSAAEDAALAAGQAPPVSLTQRAIPLLEALERSLQKKKPVVWGV